mmetsp:Transcript_29582/g.96333  ORF Transcript_29582/g.96333 Transcript_29582/m.96333 type:complete len:195 (+) Transcript_29582:3-587(+)
MRAAALRRVVCAPPQNRAWRRARASAADAETGPCVVTFRGREIEADSEVTLRSALLLSGLTPHNSGARAINCRGIGSCGTCAVECIPQSAVSPEERTRAEKIRLNLPPHGEPGNRRLRLACQVRVRASCEVVKRDKFWGEGEGVMGALPAEGTAEAAEAEGGPFFGIAEYALDPAAMRIARARARSNDDGQIDG